MSAFLMSLREVPSDEYEDIHALLDRHGLEHYRTEPSRWGISHGAVWLVDEAALPNARSLLADYQSERSQRAREAFNQARARGEVPTLVEDFLQQPLLRLAQWVGLLAALALSLLPFLWLAGLLG